MIPRAVFVLAVAGVLMSGARVVGWVFAQPCTTAEAPAATSRSGAVQSELRKRLFGGDPDRSVHGGQEMKPRW